MKKLEDRSLVAVKLVPSFAELNHLCLHNMPLKGGYSSHNIRIKATGLFIAELDYTGNIDP